MPTTAGNDIKTVADIVKKVLYCSDQEANLAEKEICKSPETVRQLAVACGMSTAAIGAGGRLAVTASASGGATLLAGIGVAGAGVWGVKRFCRSMVNQANRRIENF